MSEDVDFTLFGDLTWLDEAGRSHQWRVAGTTVDLPVGDDVFTMHQQVTLLVAGNKTGKEEHPAAWTRQIHMWIDA